jgi:hypothetical protein
MSGGAKGIGLGIDFGIGNQYKRKGGKSYIDPAVLSSVVSVISTYGKTNEDADRSILKDKTGKGNDFKLLNFGFAEGSGYGLPGTDFAGWLCTDGVDDLIESVKPVSEMLEGSNEITVVSIIHQISSMSNVAGARNNNIRASYNEICLRNIVGADGVGKTGIYGYTCANIRAIPTVPVTVNNILGDKNDYSSSGAKFFDIDLFSVQGFRDRDSGALYELSQVAYAGGFIANKVLTTDEINQIIAYFNLDRPGQIIKPQLYCNIKKQGITNDNHAEFNDQLIDFVGGHNVQLNNVAWEGESGINSYPVVFGANKTWAMVRPESDKISYDLTSNKITIYKTNNNSALLFAIAYENGVVRNRTVPAFKLKVTGLTTGQEIHYKYVSESNKAVTSTIILTEDGTYDMPQSYKMEPNESTVNSWIGFLTNIIGDCNVTLEVLPTIKNTLCLDGISDFGKATGLPVLKDYTVVAERGISNNNPEKFGLISDRERKNDIELNTFVFEKNQVPYAISFGMSTSVNRDDSLKISYQSKYSYNGESIVVGGTTGNNILLLGAGLINNDIIKEYVKAAVRFLMLFPYSLSEFLLERQLRKYKAGTLYPDMIEFRPIVKSNIESYTISFYLIDNYGNQLSLLENGKYYDFSDKNRLSLVNGVIKLDNEYIDSISSVKANGIKVDINDGSFYFPVTKSPQKIDITIDRKEVLSNIKNSTWISNEQLIKNNK